jgi:hypothetical protein
MTSRCAHGVEASLTRTASTRPPQSPVTAATALALACALAAGATASSRSRNTSSAGSPCALEMNRSLLAGTARHDRRTLNGSKGSKGSRGRCGRSMACPSRPVASSRSVANPWLPASERFASGSPGPGPRHPA